MHINYTILLSVIFLFISCTEINSEKSNIILIDESRVAKTPNKFSDFFTNEEKVDLNFSEKNKDLPPGIFQLLKNKKGNFILADGYSREILMIDSVGNFEKKIGKSGKGPGEFEVLKTIKLDKNDNLWVYDLVLQRLSQFSAPDYTYSSSFNLKGRLSDFIVMDDCIIVYDPLGDEIIKKYDFEGNEIKGTYSFPKRELQIFLSRFQIRGLSRGFNDNNLYMVYPGEFAIHKYSDDLELLSKIVPQKDSNFSLFQSSPPKFPEYLDPYGYNNSHQDYWVSFNHIYNLFKIEPNILVLQLYNQTKDKSFDFYLNIYEEDGTLVSSGIELPNESILVGADEKKIYLTTPERMLDDGEIKKMTIKSYSY